MYVNDFDDNNSIEQVIFQYNGDSSYTVSLRHDLVMQMPTLKKKYLKYNSYKNQTVNDIFPFSKIKSSQTNYVYNLKTSLFINNRGDFNSVELPIQSQFSTVHAIEIEDVNQDGFKDIILGGNLYDVKPEVGRYDANYGQLFLGGKDLKFNSLSSLKSGLLFKGQVRDFAKINSIDDKNLLFNEKELDKKGIKFIKTNRGGDITYHGPGQLVCYPIFDLENFYTDIHRYLRDLEEIIVGTLDHFGIVAFGNPNETGVWLEIGSKNERKICAMGIKVSRWVTMHGLALNVNTDLSYFEGIIPCGINNKGVTSINNELSQKVDLKKVREIMIKNFEKKFNVIIDS